MTLEESDPRRIGRSVALALLAFSILPLLALGGGFLSDLFGEEAGWMILVFPIFLGGLFTANYGGTAFLIGSFLVKNGFLKFGLFCIGLVVQILIIQDLNESDYGYAGHKFLIAAMWVIGALAHFLTLARTNDGGAYTDMVRDRNERRRQARNEQDHASHGKE